MNNKRFWKERDYWWLRYKNIDEYMQKRFPNLPAEKRNHFIYYTTSTYLEYKKRVKGYRDLDKRIKEEQQKIYRLMKEPKTEEINNELEV